MRKVRSNSKDTDASFLWISDVCRVLRMEQLKTCTFSLTFALGLPNVLLVYFET